MHSDMTNGVELLLIESKVQTKLESMAIQVINYVIRFILSRAGTESCLVDGSASTTPRKLEGCI